MIYVAKQTEINPRTFEIVIIAKSTYMTQYGLRLLLLDGGFLGYFQGSYALTTIRIRDCRREEVSQTQTYR
jgi:hypothetical protein